MALAGCWRVAVTMGVLWSFFRAFLLHLYGVLHRLYESAEYFDGFHKGRYSV